LQLGDFSPLFFGQAVAPRNGVAALRRLIWTDFAPATTQITPLESITYEFKIL
jgi:hypothetical protein